MPPKPSRILYNRTVLMIVYPMRARNVRRPPSEILRTGGVKGWLHYRRAPLDEGTPNMQAFLTDGRTGQELLLPLNRAVFLRVDGVTHLAGVEYFLRGRKGRAQRWKQSWLCVPEGQEEEAVRRIQRITAPPISSAFGDYEDYGLD